MAADIRKRFWISLVLTLPILALSPLLQSLVGLRDAMRFSGDHQATAKWASDQVGLDEVFAEVLPQDKAAKVKEVQARGVLVAMTGDVVAIVELSRATYRKMIQNLVWATGYNVVAIPLAAGALFAWGVVLTPAVGAVLVATSTVIVAVNARLLRLKK